MTTEVDLIYRILIFMHAGEKKEQLSKIKSVGLF